MTHIWVSPSPRSRQPLSPISEQAAKQHEQTIAADQSTSATTSPQNPKHILQIKSTIPSDPEVCPTDIIYCAHMTNINCNNWSPELKIHDHCDTCIHLSDHVVIWLCFDFNHRQWMTSHRQKEEIIHCNCKWKLWQAVGVLTMMVVSNTSYYLLSYCIISYYDAIREVLYTHYSIWAYTQFPKCRSS